MRAERPSLPPASPQARIQKWIWILIYGGMVAIGLGLAVRREDAALGWLFLVPALLAIVVGIVLIWVRSRMGEPVATPSK